MRRLLLFAVCAALLAGCKVDTTLTIHVREDGSGVVEVQVDLDADAVGEAEVGDGKLEDRVRLGDLDDAGWTVSRWKRHDDGGATLRISKEFAEPSDLAGVVAELSGPDGPVQGVELSRERNIVRTSYDVDGDIDLASLNTGIADDPELVANLTAQRVDVGTLDLHLLDQINRAFTLEIRVELPGKTRTLTVKPGEEASLKTSSTRVRPARPVLLGAAVVLGLAAVAILLTGERRDRRRRRGPPTPDPTPPATPGSRAAIQAERRRRQR